MISRLAQFALRLHILKKASSLELPERLCYLRLARQVHGGVRFFLPPFAVFVGFVAVWAFFPHVGVVLHLDDPDKEGTRDILGAGVFLSLAIFLTLGIFVIRATREILAALFVLNFIAFVGSVRRSP